MRVDDASPFGPPAGHTIPTPAVTDVYVPDEPRPSRMLYIVLAIGVLAVVAALALVVG
jgi:hypothetical protein